MATALWAKPPPTAIEDTRRLSAMVEHAPYSPKAGRPVLRREKLEEMHWFNKSPEHTKSMLLGCKAAFCSSSSSASF